MKTKVFLHIGTNKTGTTALQHFFKTNRKNLKKRRLLYPKTACPKWAHYPLSEALGFVQSREAKDVVNSSELITLKKKMRREIDRSAAQFVVLSSENFVLPRNIEPVREFFSLYDTKIVIYLRRHDGWLPSAYCQAVKMVTKPPWRRNFDNYVKFRKQQTPWFGRYRDLLDRWSKGFGKENIIVRPYERQQNQPSLIADFMSAIGLDSILQQIESAPEIKNKSLSSLALNLVDVFQRVDVEPEIRSRLIRQAVSLPVNEENKFKVSPALRRQLVDEHSADYRYIAREYLGREDGCLFYNDLPDPQESWEEPERLSVMRAVEETVRAIK